jgi:FtsP/CotA-like multicopper oxidase with cupredoxin domain
MGSDSAHRKDVKNHGRGANMPQGAVFPEAWRLPRWGGLLLAAALLTGAAAEADPPPHSPQGPKSQEPPVSSTTSWNIYKELKVKYANNRLCRTLVQGKCKEWDAVKLRSYNGQLVGPTMEVRPGDTLHILLDNHLPPEPSAGPQHDPNVPHGFNTTNLHTHGLHVSPAGNSDNVMLSIGPGHKFEYEIKIPADHPAGTFWYHGHKHGSAAIQVASGMAGALIVRGGIDLIPGIRDAREQIFVFQQIPYTLTDDPYEPGKQANMVEDFEGSFAPGRWEALGRRTTINGVVEPTISMAPGEVQRWRFIHAGVRESLRLRLVRETNPQAVVPQYQIAHDGITTGRLDEVEETEMHPGYRTDVMVRAGRASETYLLVDEESTPAESFAGVAESRKVLARIEVQGRPTVMPLPEASALARHVPFKPIPDKELTGTQEARYEMDVSVFPPRFLINGKPYDPHAPPRQLELGAVEEWTVSTSRFSGHIFHIHVNPFQVMNPDGTVLWRDTLFVRPSSSVKLRSRYRRYVGRFVNHCHILDHEDLGMMEEVEIFVPGGGPHGPHH